MEDDVEAEAAEQEAEATAAAAAAAWPREERYAELAVRRESGKRAQDAKAQSKRPAQKQRVQSSDDSSD